MEHDLVIIAPNNKVLSVNGSQGTLSRMIGTPAGRRALARSMVTPIRTGLDYSGMARKCFVVEQLPAGALPFIDSSDK